MNIIERYISAYVFHCLFPGASQDGRYLNYVYEVLRETDSTPKNEILNNVLAYVRQGDPADPAIQKQVAGYVRDLIGGKVFQEKAEPIFVAKTIQVPGATLFVVSKDNSLNPIAFAGCKNEHFEQCVSELKIAFPGVEFRE